MVSINIDVYYLIFKLLRSNSDRLALASTCHALRHCGVRYVLQRIISLDTTSKLISFCLFMDREPERRYALLKTCLHLGGSITAQNDPATVETQLIAHILERAISLKKLGFFVTEHPHTRLQPAIYRALGNLRALEELSLHFYWPKFCEQFLLALPLGRLTKVDLQGKFREGHRTATVQEEEIIRYAPLAILPRFHETLEEVKMAGYLELPPGPCISVECPGVWRLHLYQQQDPERHPWSIRSLIQAFPNVEELYLDAFYVDQTKVEDRQRNIDGQLSHQWKYLEYVSGRTEVVHLFGLKGPVGMLSMWHDAQDHLLDEVMQLAKPVKLAFHYIDDDFSETAAGMVRSNYPHFQMLLSPMYQSLYALCLDFSDTRNLPSEPPDCPAAHRAALDNLILAFKDCPCLAELKISVGGFKAVSVSCLSKDEDCPENLDEICLDIYARRCMMAATALEEFAFEGPAGYIGEKMVCNWTWCIEMQPNGERVIFQTEEPSEDFFYAHDNDFRQGHW